MSVKNNNDIVKGDYVSVVKETYQSTEVLFGMMMDDDNFLATDGLIYSKSKSAISDIYDELGMPQEDEEDFHFLTITKNDGSLGLGIQEMLSLNIARINSLFDEPNHDIVHMTVISVLMDCVDSERDYIKRCGGEIPISEVSHFIVQNFSPLFRTFLEKNNFSVCYDATFSISVRNENKVLSYPLHNYPTRGYLKSLSDKIEKDITRMVKKEYER